MCTHSDENSQSSAAVCGSLQQLVPFARFTHLVPPARTRCLSLSLFPPVTHFDTHTHTHGRIALELLKDPKTAETFTRRLAIICLEDGLLHPQLPLVVWTMLALVSVLVGT